MVTTVRHVAALSFYIEQVWKAAQEIRDCQIDLLIPPENQFKIMVVVCLTALQSLGYSN